MRILIPMIITLLSLSGLSSCMIDGKEQEQADSSAKTANQKEIIVYGSEECDHCIEFREELEEAGLAYTFYDVEKDPQKANEMMLKVQRTGFQGYVRFPVVEVAGVVRVSPSLEQVQRAL